MDRSNEEGCVTKRRKTGIEYWKKKYGKIKLNGDGSVPKPSTASATILR